MAKIDQLLLKTKFRGAMLGSLVGDCLGGPFEGDVFTPGIVGTVQKCIDKLDGPYFRSPLRCYSDDTVMTKCIAHSLIVKQALDAKHLACQFVEDYYREPQRGYGQNVVDVFRKLKNEAFADVYRPAREQFGGTGSYGNGGAMRIMPIALFFQNNYDAMLEAARKCTEITHTHPLGVNGAILQCLAVHQALHSNPANDFNAGQFARDLIDKLQPIEDNDKPRNSDQDPFPYKTQLTMIQQLLTADSVDKPMKIEEVIAVFGNSVAALYSVPTAIYCFLKAHSGFPEVKCENIFRRAIQYAMSMGGDTDTISAMTGAITGAYFGEAVISENLMAHCEGHADMLNMANQLFDASLNIEKS